jgi:competence protein ComEA
MNPPTPATDPTAEAERVQPASQPTFHLFSFLLGLLTALALVGGSVLLLHQSEPAPIAIQPPPTAAPTALPMPSPTPPPITVFVSGAVMQPGLYELPASARVGDALTLAGGLQDAADALLINQAERLWDGAQIHVPTQEQANLAVAPAAASAPPAGLSGSPPVMTGRITGLDLSLPLININQAAQAELETLPGIGPSKAAAILANRPYATVDDLTRVPGIGEKTVEQLRAYVTAE